mmetsp:Transcript_32392/g.55257  ORF Transcript_32392/g.55257 Transcript_32392/m.55257 type:complete len:143 (+) Transcript_32392:448-876(+)
MSLEGPPMHKASEGVNVMFLDTLIQSGGIVMNKSMSSKVVALDEMQSDWMSITMVMVVVCTLIQSGGIVMNKSMSSKVVALDEMQSDWMSDLVGFVKYVHRHVALPSLGFKACDVITCSPFAAFIVVMHKAWGPNMIFRLDT